MFTGPVAEQMWSDRTPSARLADGAVEIEVVGEHPTAHQPGRWLTVVGGPFEVLTDQARLRLLTTLIGRL